MGRTLISFDWAMKKLLRSKANYGILEGFLSELLKQDVKILRLLESESNKETREDKQNRVDILAELHNQEIVIIEVQVNTELHYLQRMLYGTSKAISEYLGEGQGYSEVKKIYSVNILYFSLGHGKDYIYHGTTKFIGLHQQDELELTSEQKKIYSKDKIHQIYPEYYIIKVNQFDELAKDTLDEWIYFLKKEEIKDSFKARGLLEAKNKLSTLKLSDAERWEYEGYVKTQRDQRSAIESNYTLGLFKGEEIGVEKGKKAGIEEGKKAGIEEGKKAGIEEGIEKTKAEIVKNMRKAGVSEDKIRQFVEL